MKPILLAAILLMLSPMAYSKGEKLKECNGWKGLKWGDSVEQATKEVKKVFGEKAELKIWDINRNSPCQQNYTCNTSEDRSFVFSFLKNRFVGFIITFAEPLKDGQLPSPFIRLLEKTYGITKKYTTINGVQTISIDCNTRWDNIPAKVGIDAFTHSQTKENKWTYSLSVFLTTIGETKIDEMIDNCNSNKELKEGKEHYKNDF